VGDLTTREADATFAELICADREWLNAEFIAVVSASFGAPPRWPRLPAPPRVPPGGLPVGWPAGPMRTATPPASGDAAPLRGLGHQRSPPARVPRPA
jgi:hypothetical protein